MLHCFDWFEALPENPVALPVLGAWPSLLSIRALSPTGTKDVRLGRINNWAITM